VKKLKKLLFLDFDGTLVPIAKRPDDVVLKENVRKALEDLAKKSDWKIVVISGRSLKDLGRTLSDKNLIYVGNHGLELSGKGLHLPPTVYKARRASRILGVLAAKLNTVFYFWPGVTVENKVYTLSLHFRNIRKDRKLAFNELVNFYKEKYKKHPIIWRRGKKVWDIRPAAQWDKGRMALHVTKTFRGAVPIAIGDDETDEDLFKAIRTKGIAIRVGYSKKSCADYYFKSQRDVPLFLQSLAD
jgi:trehalose 6-phosphate phosphatase